MNLQACNGSLGQSWEVTGSSGNYQLHPATNSGLCLDVYYGGASDGTPVLACTCTGVNNQSWAIKFWELHDSLLGDAASLTAADIDERARLDAHGEVMSVIKTVVGAASFDSFKAALDPLLAPAG